MKYKELTGICKTAIEHEYCSGCQRLEMEEFIGVEKCENMEKPLDRIKKILGVQQKIEFKQ